MASCRSPLLALALISVALLSCACVGAPKDEASAGAEAGAYPVEVTSCGVTATVEAPPKTALTMNQGATEVALALGVEDRLAGTAFLDDTIPEKWRAAYDSVPVLAEEYPDHETVLSAQPDFVYSSYDSAFDSDAAGARAPLHELGAATYVSPLGCGTNSPQPDVGFDAVWKEIADIATVFGVPERAEQLRAKQAEQLAELKKESVGKGTEVFWFDSGDKTAFAGAGDGGPQVILDAIGATNVFADVDGAWADVSWEDVIAADPEVIVLPDADFSRAKDKIARLKQDPALSQLTAVREERFVTIPFPSSTPGVRLIDGATSVADQIRDLDLR